MFASSSAGFTLGMLLCLACSLYAGWATLIDRPRAQASAPERIAERLVAEATSNFESGMNECTVGFTGNDAAGARLDLITPRVVQAIQRRGLAVTNVQHGVGQVSSTSLLQWATPEQQPQLRCEARPHRAVPHYRAQQERRVPQPTPLTSSARSVARR